MRRLPTLPSIWVILLFGVALRVTFHPMARDAPPQRSLSSMPSSTVGSHCSSAYGVLSLTRLLMTRRYAGTESQMRQLVNLFSVYGATDPRHPEPGTVSAASYVLLALRSAEIYELPQLRGKFCLELKRGTFKLTPCSRMVIHS